jgi:hypothetical protein
MSLLPHGEIQYGRQLTSAAIRDPDKGCVLLTAETVDWISLSPQNQG